MRLTVITPVGPGHERLALEAVKSVARAAARPHDFSEVRHIVIDDTAGQKGRSRARNEGMGEADWYFFLDADDVMAADALSLNDFNAPATFGAISLNGTIIEENRYPCDWAVIAHRGAVGTLAMGFFCRADVARELKFNEARDFGEDFDFYLRLPSFVKIRQPLVHIGYDQPSAGGPRGYDYLDWETICGWVISDAIEREPAKFGVSGDAVLAAAGGS